MACTCIICTAHTRRYKHFFAVCVLSVCVLSCSWKTLHAIKMNHHLHFAGGTLFPFLEKLLPKPNHIQGENHPGHLNHPPRPPVGPRGRRRSRWGPGAGLLNPVCIPKFQIKRTSVLKERNPGWTPKFQIKRTIKKHLFLKKRSCFSFGSLSEILLVKQVSL